MCGAFLRKILVLLVSEFPLLSLIVLLLSAAQELGSVIEEVVVGTGPCGELRFPVSSVCALSHGKSNFHTTQDMQAGAGRKATDHRTN